jgi:hypothetical protein
VLHLHADAEELVDVGERLAGAEAGELQRVLEPGARQGEILGAALVRQRERARRVLERAAGRGRADRVSLAVGVVAVDDVVSVVVERVVAPLGDREARWRIGSGVGPLVDIVIVVAAARAAAAGEGERQDRRGEGGNVTQGSLHRWASVERRERGAGKATAAGGCWRAW